MSSHGKDGYFAVEDSAATTLRNLTSNITNIAFNESNDIHDDTTMGAEAHTKRAGLTDGSIVLNGLYDSTATTGAETVLASLVGLEVSVAFEYGPAGNGSGAVKKSGECVLESYNISEPVADLVSFDATLQITGGVTKGTFAP